MSIPATERHERPFRWFILATLFVVTATTAISLISPAPLVGEIVETSGLDAGTVTWMTMGSFNLFVACAALFGGVIVDRLGFARVYLIGLALILVGWLLIPVYGDSYWGMFGIRFLQGIGTGPIMGSAAAVAANHFPVKERGIVTGVQGAAMGGGVAVGLSLVPTLFEATGDWHTALRDLWPAAVLGLVMAAVVAVRAGTGPSAELDVDTPHTSEHQLADLKVALLKPVTWAAIGSVVLMSWVYQAFNDLTPGFLALDPPQGIGLGPTGSHLLIGAQVAYVVSALLCGPLVERVFHGRARPTIVLGFAIGSLMAYTLLLITTTTNHSLIVVQVSICTFFYAWVNPSALGYIAKNYPRHITGKLGGITQGLGIFGGTIGVAAGSAALSSTGNYHLSITIMATVGVVGVLFGLFVKHPSAPAATGGGTGTEREKVSG